MLGLFDTTSCHAQRGWRGAEFFLVCQSVRLGSTESCVVRNCVNHSLVHFMHCCLYCSVSYIIDVSSKLFLSQSVIFTSLCLPLSSSFCWGRRQGACRIVLGCISGNTKLGNTVPKLQNLSSFRCSYESLLIWSLLSDVECGA